MACPLAHERPAADSALMLATVVRIGGPDAHDAVLRGLVKQYGGRTWSSAGGGVLATFDAPSRAIRCLQQARWLGLELRAGMHAGQVEATDGHLDGVAVEVAARVLDAAQDRTVVVSRTVAEMVIGSGLDLVALGRRGDLTLFAPR